MLDIKEKRHITVVGRGGGSSSVEWDDIENKPEFATVATSGDYDDLQNKPTIPTVPTDVSAFNNDAGYLDSSDLKDELVDTYNFFYEDPDTGDLTPNWVDFASMNDELYNYGILDIDAGTGDYVYEPDYNDLQNKPTIPAAQVNADWNANSGVAQILNKPTIPTVPAMATETLTFTLQGGTTKTIEFYTVPNYFYVEDISGSNNTLSITKNTSTSPTIEVFKSTDKTNWESMGTTNTTAITATIPANGKLYLKANANALWCGNGEYNSITASGNHNVGGNILSLIYSDNFEGKTTLPTTSYYGNSGFTQLFFNDTKLINANNLILPLTTTIKGVYNSMFWGCTNLVTAPSELPATTMTDSCYSSMFRNCSSLTTAPALPATILDSYSYASMFNGCTNLNKVVTYASNISASGCLTNWLNNVAATGDFFRLGTASFPSGVNGIPSGWIEHTSL